MCAIVVSATLTADAAAQTPPLGRPATPVFSMGQPPRWLPYAAALVGNTSSVGFGALVGVQRPILNPIIGLLAASGEVGAFVAGDNVAADVRLVADAPALALGLGVDWQPANRQIDALLRFQSAVRRGGIIGHGSMMR